MKKIISLFQQNYETDRLVRNEVTPGAEWVLAGEGVGTRKFDGTACLIRDGKFYKRYEVKPGGLPPVEFESANEVDEATGKQQGWVPVGDGAEDKWHRQAYAMGHCLAVPEDEDIPGRGGVLIDGTYELCGPKVQGNPDGFKYHWLVAHSMAALSPRPPRDYEGLREYLKVTDIEGVVWHHPDGRMVKIKKRDYGFKRRKS